MRLIKDSLNSFNAKHKDMPNPTLTFKHWTKFNGEHSNNLIYISAIN